ncbi:hypothetical protein BMF35_a1547 [Aurantiacibacter gangjinensis]|nr:hypothetical protein BMF35_a1547 [Aurantiacibacter gangjinensis]
MTLADAVRIATQREQAREDERGRPGPAPLFNADMQAAFCTALADHGNVRLACRAVGVSSQTAYRARRVCTAFRTGWEAACILARQQAEQVLADRALNGVEETVFYHGEEVATRTRYDGRLLLAHLARLDRKEAAARRCATCDAPVLDEGDFDHAMEALREGAEFAPEQCSRCSRLAGEAEAGAADTDDGLPDLERRLQAMEAALPRGAQERSGLTPTAWFIAEAARLAAFESGAERWWLAVDDDDWRKPFVIPELDAEPEWDAGQAAADARIDASSTDEGYGTGQKGGDRP